MNKNRLMQIRANYKRFPFSGYVIVAKKGLTHLSNVNFGQMEFIVESDKEI